MPFFHPLPIMPKAPRTQASAYGRASAPYPASDEPKQNAPAIWTAESDRKLLEARASGLNWGPIAAKYFPGKSGNACRKRHERLIERRHVEEWDSQKLDQLAAGYMELRQQMWEMLASRLGERWNVIEAKCMEKGLRNLQITARTAQRKDWANRAGSVDEQGTTDHTSDSGIGMCSDAEMELDSAVAPSTEALQWQPHPSAFKGHRDHVRAHSLPQSLPQLTLYQPPPPPIQRQHGDGGARTSMARSGADPVRRTRCSPHAQIDRGGMSIDSVLSPVDHRRA